MAVQHLPKFAAILISFGVSVKQHPDKSCALPSPESKLQVLTSPLLRSQPTNVRMSGLRGREWRAMFRAFVPGLWAAAGGDACL